MHDVQRLTGDRGALVGVIEAFRSFHRDVDRKLARQQVAALGELAQQELDVFAFDALHRDEVVFADLSKIVDAHDVRGLKHRRDLRLVHEHAHKLIVHRQVAQDALDDQQVFKPAYAEALGAKDLRHPTHRDAIDEVVLAECFGSKRRCFASVAVRRRLTLVHGYSAPVMFAATSSQVHHSRILEGSENSRHTSSVSSDTPP